MKLKAQVYQPQDSSSASKLPPILDNLRELFIPDILKWLRIFGIAKVSIKPAAVGICTINDISCRTMPEAVPELMRVLQKSVAKHTAELMLSFGVTELELLPTEEELVQMRQFWSTVAAVKDPDKSLVKTNALPLNMEPDPSDKPVINTLKETQEDTNGRTEIENIDKQSGSNTGLGSTTDDATGNTEPGN